VTLAPPHHRTDDGVQARAVAPAGEQSHSHFAHPPVEPAQYRPITLASAIV
jgi:hypothetical protein